MSDFQLLLPDEESYYYDNYFTKTEELFSALRGRTLLLSPADYQLARKWYDQGIPLSCVLRGIRAAFYHKMQKDEDYEDILSLSFCKWAVTKEWKEYKQVSLEKAEVEPDSQEQSDDQTKAVLDSLLFDLQKSIHHLKESGQDELSQLLLPIYKQVAELSSEWQPGQDIQELESRLAESDSMMLDIITEKAVDLKKKAVQAVKRKIKSAGLKLDEVALQETIEQGLRSKLRELLKLPKITLYSSPF